MAQAGYTPIQLYYSTTASAAPSSGNLANGELAINITDGKLYYKDNGGTVRVLAGTGGTGVVAGSNTQVQFNNNGVFGASSGLTFDGTTLTANALTVSNAVTLSGGTTNGVAYLNGSKVLTSGSALTFDGTNFATTGSVTSAGASNSGNLSFTGTGNRITGDFSNATVANRVMFQTNTTNGGTRIGQLPNGTATSSGWEAYSGPSTDLANASFGSLVAAGTTDIRISADRTGTGTYLPMTFYTGGSERMRLDTSGNLGINTSSAGSKLTVLGTGSFYASTNANTGSGYGFTLTGANSKSSASDNTSLALFSNDALASNPLTLAMSLVGNATVANGYAYLQASEYGTGNWRSIALNPSGGNVGIGTSSPQQKFHVYNAGSVYTQVQSVNASTGAGAIYRNATANWLIGAGPASGGSEFAFVDQTNGVGNPGERMRIDSSGNLLVGTTTQRSAAKVGIDINPATNAAIVIYPTSNVGYDAMRFLNNSGTQIGSINVGTTSTNYATSSDYRLKENIQPMTGALDFVRKQRPVTYRWKATGTEGSGYIAHWMQEDGAGNCVTGTKDAVDADGKPVYQGIDTSFMVAPLNAAINELADIVEAQAAIITQLKARLDAANL